MQPKSDWLRAVTGKHPFVNLFLVSSELCQSWYGSDFDVLPDQICAGHAEGKRDACVGDSGGPMVKNFDDEGSDVYYQSK